MASNYAESELLSEVIAVCNDLGHKNKRLDNKYILNKRDANNVTKDLIRYLRNDDKHKFTVRKQLGFTNIVDNDLIPIVEQYSIEDIQLFDKVLRLLVDLTNPSIILFQQRLPNDKTEQQIYLELQSILYSYKLSFGSHKIFWTVLAKHLTRILRLNEDNRQIEDTLMFERILILIRNVLHIPIDENSDQKVSDTDTNPHDRILELMHSSGINDLILLLANDVSHQDFCFHLIEIISLMFREQNAEFIAKTVPNYGSNVEQRSDFEREIDRKELKELKTRDLSQTIKTPKNFSRFNGTFYVKNMKSISNRDIIFHKNPENLDQINFDSNKEIKRKAKNRQPMTDNCTNRSERGAPVVHKSAPKIRKILFDFCSDFLTGSYSQFMAQIKGSLSRNMSQVNDETYYLWAIQFFMEFNRCNPKTNDNSLVIEMLSMETFHFLQTQIEHHLDSIKSQKEEFQLWSKRLHYGLRAYREMLFSLNYFDSDKDQTVRQTAKYIKKQLFYEVEYRDLLLLLLHDYNEAKMSKPFLKDLIETNHVFLKMLENYYKTNSRLLIRQKVRRVKRKKSQKKKQKDKTTPEQIWSEISCTVSEAVQGNIDLPAPDEDVTVRAFDPTSDKPIDEQKMDVMRRVNQFLRDKRVVEAIALYRDARNCWSGDEDNAFGAQDILPEDEILSLTEVLMTDFPEEPTIDEENDEEVNDEELVNEETHTKTREVEIQLSEVINKYCQPNVVKTYALLLRNYDKNSDETNHCVVKMLHRIGFECKMHGMLFQASIFRTFQRILSDPLRNQSSSVKELSTFAKYVISKFKAVAQKNNKVFTELLFWKNCREANELEEGYERNTTDSKHTKQLWTEEQDLELKVLFEEFKDKSDGDKDYIDLILEKMIDETKTRRQLIRQLKQLDLYFKVKPKRKPRKKKNTTVGENFFDDDSSNDENDRQFTEGNPNNYSDKSDHSDEDNQQIVKQTLEDNEDIIKETLEDTNKLSDNNTGNSEEQLPEEKSDKDEDIDHSFELSSDSEVDEEIVIKRKPKVNKNIVFDDSEDSSDGPPVPEVIETTDTTDKRVLEDSDEEEVVISSKKKRKVFIEDENDD